MGRFLKRSNLWVRRKSFLPMFFIGSLIVLLLFLNEDASFSLNMQYDREIDELNEEIALCRDSAAYFRNQREAILHENTDLEKMAREKFHMQRPTEDVFIIK